MARIKLQSIAVRVWLVTVASFAIGLLVLGLGIAYILDRFPDQVLGNPRDMEFAEAVRNGITFDGVGNPTAVRLPEKVQWLFDVMPTEMRYRIVDRAGRTLVASTTGPDSGGWLRGDPAGYSGTVQRVLLDSRPFRIATLKTTHQASTYYVQTASSGRLTEALVSEKLRSMRMLFSIAAFLATLVFGFAISFSLRRILRPLHQASKMAANVSPKNLTARLSVTDMPREIAPVISAFNGALDRLEQGFINQQRFLGSAAHELQTPLTLIRGQIELHPDMDGKESLLSEIDLMARQVKQLLHLAEASELHNSARVAMQRSSSTAACQTEMG